MVFRLYDGLLKVVQWNEGKDLRGFNVRCDDLYIIDITFMSDPGNINFLQKLLSFGGVFIGSEFLWHGIFFYIILRLNI